MQGGQNGNPNGMQMGYNNQGGYPNQGGNQMGYVNQGNPNMMQGQNMMQNGMAVGNPGVMAGQVMPSGYRDGYSKLANCQAVFIKQKFQALEALTLGICQKPNVYQVFDADPEELTPRGELFKGIEKSGFCVRICLPPDCRPFKMWVDHSEKHTVVPGTASQDGDPFLKIDRPYSCTYLCFNRPVMEIEKSETQNPNDNATLGLGTSKNPWACCDILFDVRDNTGDILYKIVGNCCQCGLFMQCPCAPYNKVIFDIKDRSDQIVGSIQKLWSGCLRECCSQSDNFACIFPPKATPQERALILSATLFIDFRFFEDKTTQEQDNLINQM
mmetsp:Transcript_49810/g.57164  ORF Transcript_49810/g.57164 Transcript_49810/m.57164 type:complete len:328 (+) Transcript_49810:83-1066(+)|eukprot:CAMPEP_0115000930 /NCGR_PEP_ID=MMETSP0216-20121206/17057_1 /TAXON_ID=223996 /ORGANISM="Protocruzia adherens, Strain Boccale" /LENGTH=327 /DNA_ID=CAMNT_0002366135 /DNA_START=217 /DNA_END=1200 /DNA_ORIENTATION=-